MMMTLPKVRIHVIIILLPEVVVRLEDCSMLVFTVVRELSLLYGGRYSKRLLTVNPALSSRKCRAARLAGNFLFFLVLFLCCCCCLLVCLFSMVYLLVIIYLFIYLLTYMG